ncbi:MAG TPA: acyl-CoA dehydrogenase [Dehalococcoidia bacterium]|jgi:alkylation response protein AidB-like acyl-CoA dehydrogenase|nr:acyl-CoA dehydrogenase family protein [Dehalococcoidia bacterium]MEC9280936.1 acyl-CoA dehydrogenase family protein [Chloroflexota bacterium]MEC9287849.1 acyl-CoA dehydrogenase family protein [Chloroflexota bacterium]MEE3141240.1 acyl-CoA dehydrogenase family protein [Chloroflexota bacterium]HAI09705.1 acyl-CoA dehydrogenase [Dehalococcoidia bacterium]|tara:strand:+ start:265 stop:1422 length:1158 start_codon:yes stop_codon:yes gene_type:complete
MPDLILNEEEQMLQTLVRDFADRELIPRAKEADEKQEFSWENWRGMAGLGLTGVGIDTEYGGSGPAGYRKVSIVAEEVARGDAGASVSVLAHLSLGTTTIYRFGNEEQKKRLVPSLASGKGIAAWALTEPGGGSDAAALQTTATERDGMYFLNGSKMFITNASVAESIVVFATHDRSLGYKGISAFVVHRDSPGLTVNPLHGKMGMRSSTTDEVVFQDTPVPMENRLGEEGRGFNYAMDILDSSRIIIAAQCVGIGQSALEAAVRYAQQRETFGKPIAQHQAIQFMLAEMATAVHGARIATMNAATLKDEGLPFVNEASMAKLIASEMCVDVSSKAMQVHGGIGYFQDAGVERIFRDARVTTIYEGTSEVQKLIIARQILAQYPL